MASKKYCKQDLRVWIGLSTNGTTIRSGDDETKKSLFAYDEDGNFIGQSEPASQVPVVVTSEMCGGKLIYAVEFDTLPGAAGGSNDGTVFLSSDFDIHRS